MKTLENGLIAVCKRDCPTCAMIEPALSKLSSGSVPFRVYTQDDPSFPRSVIDIVDDTNLEFSYRFGIEVVPSLLRFENGRETGRIIGWNKTEWRDFTGISDLGMDLPENRPGCGSKNVEPGIAEKLAVLFGGIEFAARKIEFGPLEDDIEACYKRGWTDGLPVVPPTEERVWRMLQATSLDPKEIVAVVPPNQGSCTVEKAAINAVMAGCKPEYLPVVIAAIAAACEDEFCLHGVVATTHFVGPLVLVNGPVTKLIGMNSGINVLGQGNRANATIGRALQLLIRNIGGGRPGGVDRATMGNPGKYTFCFAEDEDESPWEPFSVEQGFAPDTSTVTLFAAEGVRGICDQKSRTPESLARSFAAGLRTVAHPKLPMATDAMLVVSPEHARIFKEAEWTKKRLKDELATLLRISADELLVGAGDMEEGISKKFAGQTLSKFRPDGLHVVHAGGTAGLFSAIIGGWLASGPAGSSAVTREILP